MTIENALHLLSVLLFSVFVIGLYFRLWARFLNWYYNTPPKGYWYVATGKEDVYSPDPPGIAHGHVFVDRKGKRHTVASDAVRSGIEVKNDVF